MDGGGVRRRTSTRRFGPLAIAALLSTASWSAAAAQQPDSTLLAAPAAAQAAAQAATAPLETAISPDSVELVDRVVAVVGDTALLWSEILETLIQLKAQGQEIPPVGTPAFDSVATRTTYDLVDQLILLEKAEESDVQIPDEVLEGEVDRRFREIRNSFPSASAFQDAVARSGRTLVQYRQMLRGQVRAQLMIDQFISENRDDLPPVSVSEEEIRAFFEERLAGQTRPATVSFEQLVVEPTPSEAAEDSARAVAETALREIREGTEFEIAARRYSQDFANRDQGGDLGWVKRSQLVPAFARAAWAARTGEPIGPVRTRFGFHIIKVENVRGGERKIRHILVQPTMTESDLVRARDLAAALADSVRGGASVAELAERYGVAEIPVRIPDVPIDEMETRLGPAYAQSLARPVPGEVIGPFPTEGFLPGKPVYAVVRVLEFKATGDYELDDVREQIRRNLMFEKGYKRFLEELKNEVYVDVRL